MPPIPFHPTHQTPFKSTLSSARQSKQHHSSSWQTAPVSLSDSQFNWPTNLTIDQIDPSDWEYHCEGGKNLLVRYCGDLNHPLFVNPHREGGGGTLALRFRKKPRNSSKKNTIPSEDQFKENEHEEDEFTKQVVMPLVGSQVLPFRIAVTVDGPRGKMVLETIAARIEMDRPRERRLADAIDTDASVFWAVEDVTSGSSVLNVEIKPKWGYLPSITSLPPSSPHIDIKTKYSRFRIHKVFRQPHLSKNEFEQLYDPLDLYSDQPDRIDKAIRALYMDWSKSTGQTNNFRIFWNGKPVTPEQNQIIQQVQRFLQPQHEGNLVDQLSHILVPALMEKTMNPLEKLDFVSTDSTIPPTIKDSSCTTSIATSSVLTRLRQLQSDLDSLDIEGLAQLWLQVTGCPFPTTRSDDSTQSDLLLSPPTVSELCSALYPTSSSVSAESTSLDTLRIHILRFLLAASFKDCSLLVRSTIDSSVLSTSIKLIDLDPKPISKLEHFSTLDNQILSHFHSWLSQNS